MSIPITTMEDLPLALCTTITRVVLTTHFLCYQLSLKNYIGVNTATIHSILLCNYFSNLIFIFRYLSKGEHFFFRCIDGSNAQNSKNETKNLRHWCSWWNSLWGVDYGTDNFTMQILPMDCTYGK